MAEAKGPSAPSTRPAAAASSSCRWRSSSCCHSTPACRPMLVRRLHRTGCGSIPSGSWSSVAHLHRLMALLGVQLYQALRSRVEFGDTAGQHHPARRAAAPRPCCASSTARSPTTRSRRWRRAACCSATRSPRCCCAPPGCVTKDGQHVRLGNVNEDNVDAGAALSRDRRQDRPSAPASR